MINNMVRDSGNAKTTDSNNNSNKNPSNNDEKEKSEYKIEIVWRNIILMTVLHTSAFYGLYLHFFVAKWQTCLMAGLYAIFAGMGITAGAHRLWSHKSYKAKLPLRIILCIFNSMALQNDIYEWSRDHRVHHKYSETDADPHNSKRGFFFAHVGWLLCKKHPEVINKGKHVDLSDLWGDPVVRFQRRFYMPMITLFCFVLPPCLPYYLWKEDFATAFFTCVMFRYCLSLHSTWLVNSAAHLYGTHPYDKTIGPAENSSVVLSSLGEGYHNYHHVFPWDYSTSEFGWRSNFSLTTCFIDMFAKIGWAYDLRSVPKDMILQRIQRTGDIIDANMRDGRNNIVSNLIQSFLSITSIFYLPVVLRLLCNLIIF